MRAAIYTLFFLAFLPAQVGFAGAELRATWLDYSGRPAVSVAPPPEAFPDAQPSESPDRATVPRLPEAWTEETLRLVVKYQLNPLRAARALVYVHVAMDDALELARRRGMTASVAATAAHRAASGVLAYFFPNEPKDRLEARGFMLLLGLAGASRLDRTDVTKAWLLGNSVIAAAITRARADAADATWNPAQRPQAAPKIWRAAPPLYSFNPAEPLAGTWRTWVLKDGGEVLPDPPLEFDSAQYRREVAEVKSVAEGLTAEQKRIAEDWNLDLGTVTPGGLWNRIALQAAREKGMDDPAATRMLAVMNAAIADAFIACWHAKYKWWTVRPVNIIQERLDPHFMPLIVTPAFPSYPSGHATISGAAATVLGHFIPSRRDDLQRMSEEAALSRLYGGIHFRNDNEGGLALGRRVGRIAIERRGEPAGAR